MDVKKILKEATDNGASDIFIVAGRPLTYKSKGVMECLNEIRMIPKETFEFVTSIYALAERDISKFEETGDDDFSFAIPGVSRYRVSTFKQRGSYSAVIRVISFTAKAKRFTYTGLCYGACGNKQRHGAGYRPSRKR